MEFFFFRAIILLIGVAFAAYTDYKTGLVYDKITFPMIGLGILFFGYDFFTALFSGSLFSGIAFYDLSSLLIGIASNEIIFGIIIALIVAGFSLMLYYTGKIGGGDVKLFIGISLLLPFMQGSNIPFIISILFMAGISSIVFFGVYYLIKYSRIGFEINYNRKGIGKAAGFGMVIGVYFILLYSNGLMDAMKLAFYALPLGIALVFIAFEQGIRKNFFLKEIMIDELDEDEIIALEFMDDEELSKLNLKGKRILGKNEKDSLKEMGRESVLVYRNLPKFAPFILIGVIFSLINPDYLLIFFGP